MKAIVALLAVAAVAVAVALVQYAASKEDLVCGPQERLASLPEMAAGPQLSCEYFIQVGDRAYGRGDCQDIKPSTLGRVISHGNLFLARRIVPVSPASAVAVLDLNAGPQCDGWQRWEALGPIQ